MLTNRRKLWILAIGTFALVVSMLFVPTGEADADDSYPIYGTDTSDVYQVGSDGHIYYEGEDTGLYVVDGVIYHPNGESTGLSIDSIGQIYGSYTPIYSDSQYGLDVHDTITIDNPYKVAEFSWNGTWNAGDLEDFSVYYYSSEGNTFIVDTTLSGKNLVGHIWFDKAGTFSIKVKFHEKSAIFGGSTWQYEQYNFKVNEFTGSLGYENYPLASVDVNAGDCIGKTIYVTNNTTFTIRGSTDGEYLDFDVTSVQGTNWGVESKASTISGLHSSRLHIFGGTISSSNAEGTLYLQLTVKDGTNTKTVLQTVIIKSALGPLFTWKFMNGNTTLQTYEVVGNTGFQLPSSILASTSTEYLVGWKSESNEMFTPGDTLGVTKAHTFYAVTDYLPASSNYKYSYTTAIHLVDDSTNVPTTATVGSYYSAYLTTSNSLIRQVWTQSSPYTIQAAEMPDGFSFNQDTWRITGNFIKPGVYPIVIGCVNERYGSYYICDYFTVTVKSESDIEYVVNLHPDGGSLSVQTSYSILGGTAFHLPDSSVGTSTNQILAGWRTTISGNNAVFPINSYMQITRSTTFYAAWESTPVIILFDPNGGTVNGDSDPLPYLADSNSEQLLKDFKFVKPGYTQVGWFIKGNESNIYALNYIYVVPINGVNNTQVVFFKAYWVEDSKVSSLKTVTFDAGDGDNENGIHASTVKLEANKYVVLPMTGFVKNGYQLGGWSNSASATSKNYYIGQSVQITANKTFYAYYIGLTLTVYFHPNPGSMSSTTMTVQNNTSYSSYWPLPTPSAPTGYTFEYWYNSSGKQITKLSAISTTDSRIDLYAKYIGNSYTIYLDPNGGYVSQSSIPITYNESYVLPEATWPDASKYSAGWFTSKSGGTSWSYTGIYDVAGDTYLYAHWSDNLYTVTLDYGEGTKGSGDASEIKLAKGQLYPSTLPTPSPPDGKIFTGWYDGDNRITPGQTTFNHGENYTIHAHYSSNTMTLTLNCNGGTYYNRETYTMTVSLDSVYDLPTPTYDSYHEFKGWWTQKLNGTQVRTGDDVVSTITVLYAHWDLIENPEPPTPSGTFTVTFIISDCVTPVNSQTITSGGTATEPDKPVSTIGDAFAGWYSSSGIFNFDTPITSDITLQASWEKFVSVEYINGKTQLNIQSKYVGDNSIDWGDGSKTDNLDRSYATHSYKDDAETVTIKVTNNTKGIQTQINYDTKEHTIVSTLTADFDYYVKDGKLVLDGSKSKNAVDWNWYQGTTRIGGGQINSNLDVPTETITIKLEVSDTHGIIKTVTKTIDPSKFNGDDEIPIAAYIAVGLASVVAVGFIITRFRA